MEELKKEYILNTISLMESDKKSVLSYVYLDLALITLILAGDLFGSSPEKSFGIQIAIGVAILIHLASGYMFFHYKRQIHHATFNVLEKLIPLDVSGVKSIRESVWQVNGYLYKLGYALRVFGVVLISIVYVFLVK